MTPTAASQPSLYHPNIEIQYHDIDCCIASVPLLTSLIIQNPKSPILYSSTVSNSQQSLPSQLDLACRLPSSITPFTNTNRTALAQLDFIFDGRERAWAVVREMDAGEGGGAEVVCAVGCWRRC